MTTVAQAAQAYREAVLAHRETKIRQDRAREMLGAVLRDAKANEGRKVSQLAEEAGYSPARIYQLLEDKTKEKKP